MKMVCNIFFNHLITLQLNVYLFDKIKISFKEVGCLIQSLLFTESNSLLVGRPQILCDEVILQRKQKRIPK